MNAKNKRSSGCPPEAVIYAFAHVESWLEYYAKSHQISESELRGTVAGLLLGSTSGALLGFENRVPALRRAPAEVHQTSRKVALASRARGNATRGRKKASRTISAAGRARMRAAQKLRWKTWRERKGIALAA